MTLIWIMTGWMTRWIYCKELKIILIRSLCTQSLTLDISDVQEWQGGDIVIFENHIGVVSDRRNKNGVPYVFHHYSAEQKSHEEDILPTWTDVVGHYRWILTE